VKIKLDHVLLLFMRILLKHTWNDRSTKFKKLLKINVESDIFTNNCINKQQNEIEIKSG